MNFSHIAIVTGASKGIGRTTADLLDRSGCHVIGAARNEPDNFPGKFHRCDFSDRAATKGLMAHLTAGIRSIFSSTMSDSSGRRRWAIFRRIVNVTSLVVAGAPYRTVYSVAKLGLLSCTRSWALELARDGITVNAVAPGPMATELFHANNPSSIESELRYLRSVPMNRIAQPSEIAEVIALLASEKASFVTGQNLFVDGGASIGHAPV